MHNIQKSDKIIQGSDFFNEDSDTPFVQPGPPRSGGRGPQRPPPTMGEIQPPYLPLDDDEDGLLPLPPNTRPPLDISTNPQATQLMYLAARYGKNGANIVEKLRVIKELELLVGEMSKSCEEEKQALLVELGVR